METEAQYVLNLIQPIVTMPDDVKVDYSSDDMGVLLTVKLNQADMGRLIGKQGANVNALRTLVRQLGFTNNKRISIKVEEPEGSNYQSKE